MSSEAGLSLSPIILSNSLCLDTLDLSWNQLGASWVNDLGDSIMSCCKLKTLNLSHNRLGLKGIMSVINVVKESKTLTNLDLSFNGVEHLHAGNAELSDALHELRQTSSLTSLKITKGIEPIQHGARVIKCLTAHTGAGGDFDRPMYPVGRAQSHKQGAEGIPSVRRNPDKKGSGSEMLDLAEFFDMSEANE